MNGYTALPVATLLDDCEAGVEAATLPARVAAGDRDAFVLVYRAHFAELRAFAQRLLGCGATADDLVHDVFLALPSALGRFRGECSLKSYLFSIAVRLARRHLRTAKRRRAIEDGLVDARLAPATAGPDAAAEQRQLAAVLTAALDALPVDQRVAFVLCELEELSSTEAGQIVGESAGTVRARVFHAKKKLRGRLAQLAPQRVAAPQPEKAR